MSKENKPKVNFFISHWVAAVAIAVITIVIGLISMNSLAIEQYPDIAPPMVTINATYSGADANAVMESVVMPIEEVVNGVENMMYMVSTASANGEGEIDIYFKQGTDADEATVNVQNRVNQAMGILPEAVIKSGVTIQKNVNATLFIMSLESTNENFDQSFISNYLDINVMPAISRIAGVGRTMIMGEQYGVRIWLKPDLMGLYGVTPEEIVKCINEQNLVVPIGRLESTTDKIDLEFNGLLDDMSQFENIILRASSKGEVLRLRDVATVELGARAYDFRTNIDGNAGVMFYVKQAPGANATKVNAEIKKVIHEIEGRLPAGLHFKLLETSDDFLYAAMGSVVETLIIAIILVVLVVYFFLQNLKATIIPSISIIVSLIGTFAIVKLAGFSLNLLTLFALVLAIGTVVDDAIVVVEAVLTKMEQGEKNINRAVSSAMNEVTAACISTTLVFMAVFIPVTFVSGTAGAFYKEFGITMASAVGLSTISALTLCPALCAMMFKPENKEGKTENRRSLEYWTRLAYTVAFDAVMKKYTQVVERVIKRSKLVCAILLVFIFMLFWLMKNAQTDLVPQEDQGFLLVNIMLPPGTFLNETENTTIQLEEYIKSLDEVETVGALTGYSMMEDMTSTNYATLMVRLKNWSERPSGSIITTQKDITEWARVNLPQAYIETFQMPQIPGYGNGSNISVNLQDKTRGSDKQGFIDTGIEFVEKLKERPEVAFAASSYSQDYPKFKLDVDEIACKRMGISPRTVLETIGTYMAGAYIGSYVQYSNVYRVMVQAGKEYRMSKTSLNNIFVPVGDRMVPVSQFVSITLATGAAMEHHFNLFPAYPISTMPAPGYTSDHVRKAIEEVSKEVLPEVYGYEYSGIAREEAESAGSNDTIVVYALCMLLIYLILACLYNSLLIPWAVMFSIPFGLVGAYLIVKPLESAGIGVNIYVQTGIIMIIGLVAKTAILITEFAVQKRKEGMSIFDAAREACKDRLRPIIMTVFTMIMGMIPLVLEGGAGAIGNRSLALAVIGGMTIGTIALLFVTPAFYIIFQKLHEKLTPVKITDLAVVCVCVLLLSSCSLYRKYEPTHTVPTDIMGDASSPEDTTSLGTIGWRQLFTDPLLQQLIERGLENNTNMKTAELLIQQAQNNLVAARLGDLPTLSFEPEGSISRFNALTTRSYVVPVTATWQLGIFGQTTSKRRQAKARRQQAVDYRQAVQASLAANIASIYYTLVMYDHELEILRQTLDVWNESLESIKALYEAGLYQSPAVYRMEASLASVKSGIVELEETIVTTESSLCLLLSESPHSIERSSFGTFKMPEVLHVGIPVQLLDARPDVRHAAINMEIAYYDTQLARQAFYPNITITGNLGWSNDEDKVNPAKFLSEAIASLVQPIFAQGKLRSRYRNAKVEQEKAELQFTQTLLKAGNEVYKYLHECYKAEKKATYIHECVLALQESYSGTKELMNYGTHTYLEVLTAQEDLLTAQITEVQNINDGIHAMINLYTALGGF